MIRLPACLFPLLFIVLLFPGQALGQNPNAFSISNKFDIETGAVYDIFQSSDGYMWIGTESGLLRFDGGEFHHFYHPAFDREMTNIREDGKGHIWVQNLAGQLFKVAEDSLKLALDLSKNYHSGISDYQFLGQESLMVLPADSRKFQELDAEGQLVRDWSLPDEELIHSVSLWGDDYWVVGIRYYKKSQLHHLRLYRIHPDEGRFILKDSLKFPKSFRINRLREDSRRRQQRLLITKDGQDANFLTVDSTGFREDLPFQAENITEVNMVANLGNATTIATKRGLFVQEQKKWAHFFPELSINVFYQDREGNTWLGTARQGLFLIPQLAARNLKVGEPIFRNAVFDESGNLYALRHRGEFCYLPANGTEIVVPAQQEVNSIRMAYSSLKKAIFLDSRSEYFDIRTGQFRPGESMGYFRHMRFLNEDIRLYTSSGRGGVDNTGGGFVPAGIFRRLGIKTTEKKPKFGHPDFNGWEIAVDPLEQGIYIRHKNGIRYASPGGKVSQVMWNGQVVVATTLIEDPSDGVWAADMQGNVHRIAAGQVVETFAFDEEVRLLARGNNRLAVVHPLAVVVMDLSNAEKRRIGTAQGLLPGKILALHLGEEKLQVVNPEQLQVFHLDQLETEMQPPQVYLEEVRLFGQPIRLKAGEALAYGENQLEFDLRTDVYNSLGNHYFLYRLGYSGEWIRLEAGNPVIRFDRLSPGDYDIAFRACRADGQCSPGKTVSFSIDVHFTQKWWFICGIALLLGLIIYLLLQFRISAIRRQSQLEKESESLRKEAYKSKITAIRAQMNPHFMFNALNTIQEFIVTNESEVASEYLADFADLMRKYLDQSREDEVSLSEELETMELYLKLEQLRFGEDFNYTIHCSDKVDQEVTRLPVMLLQPFVENAIRHGLLHRKGRKELLLSIEEADKGGLSVVIEDNGIGRQASAEMQAARKRTHRSFATSAIQDRIALINQEGGRHIKLEYQDLKNEKGEALGTRVMVTILPQR